MFISKQFCNDRADPESADLGSALVFVHCSIENVKVVSAFCERATINWDLKYIPRIV